MTLYLIRGLPGTGKTTLAETLTSFVAEADHYFETPEGGYHFDPSKLPAAHAACLAQADAWMAAQVPQVAVANTFTQRWELAPYLEAAARHGYRVIEIALTHQPFGSVHNVPQAAIDRMRQRWEW